MGSVLRDLEERKRALEQQRDDISEEIKRLESLIMQYRAGKRANLLGEKISQKTMSKIHTRAFIIECLKRYGNLTSMEILEIDKEMSSEGGKQINYNTLRSHLMRMKHDGYIDKDNKKRWCLVNASDYTDDASNDAGKTRSDG